MIPVGSTQNQHLLRIVKREGRTIERLFNTCQFVPFLRRDDWRRDAQEANRA